MPRLVDHPAKRAAFIAAMRRVLAQAGLAGATLRGVAAEAGCTTGALTHYFADRDALLLGLLTATHAETAARMAAVIAATADPLARVLGLAREALPLDDRGRDEWRVWLAFWAEAVGNAHLAAENHRRIAEWRDALATAFNRAGGGAQATSRAVSLVMAMIDGFGVQLALPPPHGAEIADRRAAAWHAVERQIRALWLELRDGGTQTGAAP